VVLPETQPTKDRNTQKLNTGQNHQRPGAPITQAKPHFRIPHRHAYLERTW